MLLALDIAYYPFFKVSHFFFVFQEELKKFPFTAKKNESMPLVGCVNIRYEKNYLGKF